MTDPFANRVAIVTGGASGIGRALCEELGRRSAFVVVADRNADGARAVTESISAQGGRATAASLDVTRPDDVAQLVDSTAREQGRLDYMFNNAGIGVGGEIRNLSFDHWRACIDVNLWGVIYGVTAAYRVMLGQGFGHIVNTASAAGLLPEPTMAPYSVTKFGVVALSAALRAEARAFGIHVSVVCPGFIDTAIYENAIGIQVDKDEFVARLPIRLMSAPAAAGAILRGVARRRAIIVFPFYARLLWWLTRLHPNALDPLHRRVLRHFREQEAAHSFENPSPKGIAGLERG